ncbi:MAG: SPASM domain-containing protein, partial [Bacteroidales bacterium]|nr:SPASM domain-containing protein [Bacteroidales bacterium]
MKKILKRIRDVFQRNLVAKIDSLESELRQLSRKVQLDNICITPFNNFGISIDGTIYPCCNSWCQHYAFGNIFESDFQSVWNSDKAKEFRRTIWDGTYKYCLRGKCFPAWGPKSDIIADYVNDGTMLRAPKSVDFSHDQTCNVLCTTCRSKPVINSPERQEMLDRLIEKTFLPLCKDAEKVYINGSGEVFASSNSRKLVMQIAKRYPDISFHIHSNGVLCDEENLKNLGILYRTSAFTISIHAATKETYNQIVRGGDFDRVMKNVNYLAQLR